MVLLEATQHGVRVLLAHDDADDVRDGAPAADGEARHGRRVVDAQLATHRRQVFLRQVHRACARAPQQRGIAKGIDARINSGLSPHHGRRRLTAHEGCLDRSSSMRPPECSGRVAFDAIPCCFAERCGYS